MLLGWGRGELHYTPHRGIPNSSITIKLHGFWICVNIVKTAVVVRFKLGCTSCACPVRRRERPLRA
eukprot:6081617-Pyramimonas_sp.AAC.1